MEAHDPQPDDDVAMIQPEPVAKEAPPAAAAAAAAAPSSSADRPPAQTKATEACLAHPAPQDEVPGLSTSSSASESSAARSPPPPAEFDFDHPTRHVQPAFFYPTPNAVPADYYVHSRRAPGGAGSRTQDTSRGFDANGELYLDPEEDEECKRGIPVFKPTMEEFIDFEGYMNLVDHWGRRSGIVKVIPPQEWIEALPKIPPHAIADVKIRSPIQQHMQGRAGLFRVNNVERKKPLSVKEWFEKCTSSQYRTPNLHEMSRSDRPVTGAKKEKEPAGPPKAKHPNQWTYRKKAAAEAAKAAEAAAASLAALASGESQAPALPSPDGEAPAPAAPAPSEGIAVAPTAAATNEPSSSATGDEPPPAVAAAGLAEEAAPSPSAAVDASAPPAEPEAASAPVADVVATSAVVETASGPPAALAPEVTAGVADAAVPAASTSTSASTSALVASSSTAEATYAVAPARRKVVALYSYRPKPIPRPPPLESASNGAPPAEVALDADVQVVRRKQPNQWTYRDQDNSTATSSTAAAAVAVAKPPVMVLDENGQLVRRKQPNQWTYRDKPKPSAVPALSSKVMVLDENGQLVRRKQPNQWTYRDKPKAEPSIASSSTGAPAAAAVDGASAPAVLDESGQPVRKKQPNQWTYRSKPRPGLSSSSTTTTKGKKLPPLVLDANGNWVKRKQPNQWTYRDNPKPAAGSASSEPSAHASATFDFVPPPPPALGEAPVQRKQPNQWTYRKQAKAAAASTAGPSALTEAALGQQNDAIEATAADRSRQQDEQRPGSPAPSDASSNLSSLSSLEDEDEESTARRAQPNQHTPRSSAKGVGSIASSSATAAAAAASTVPGEAPIRRKQPNQWTYRNLPKPGASESGGDRGTLPDATDGRDIKPLPAVVKPKQPNQWTYRNTPKQSAAAAAAVAAATGLASPSVSSSSLVADGETPVRRKQPNQWTYRNSPKQALAASATSAPASASSAAEGVAPVKRKQPNQWTYRDKPKPTAASTMSPAVQVAGQKRKQPNQWTYRNKDAPAPVVATAPAASASTSTATAAVASSLAAADAASPMTGVEATRRTPPIPEVSMALLDAAAPAPAAATLGEQMATIAAALRTDGSTAEPVLKNMQVDPKQEVDIAPVAAVVAAADAAEAEASTSADKGKGPEAAVADAQVDGAVGTTGLPPAVEETETFTSNPAPRKRRRTPPPEETVDPWYETLLENKEWMPEGTKAEDFTEEACRELERKFWRGLGVGESAWYGADLQGSFFTEETTEWNVAALPNLLNRLKMKRQLPGVNTPYLYWGMWRAAFAWHVEDMDLYSVNYLHFGAPKFWYAVPQAKADALERTMRSYFPSDVSECDQFLRHKSFAASPQRLSQDAVRPNVVVQHPNEFIFTFPRGYHSGFNTGFNCAESINFALDSWIDLGRKARYCTCIDDSVRMDVDAILREHQMLADLEHLRNVRAEQERERLLARTQLGERKRIATPQASVEPTLVKKIKPDPAPAPIPKIVLKPIKPAEPIYPCVLCASNSVEGLLECTAVPSNVVGKTRVEGKRWFAHELCAVYIPETYVIEIEIEENGVQVRRKLVDGVCNIPKDRWNLGCSVCTRPMLKKMGGKIQCDKGKCPRAFHVTCAEVNEDTVLREFDHAEWVLADDPAAVPRQFQITTRKRECVCSTHNPAVKERKKQESLAKQRSMILAYKPSDLIKIRSKSGMIYEVPLVAISTERETVSVYWLDGRAVETPWTTVVDPSSYAPKPSKKAQQSGAANALQAASQPSVAGQPFDHTRGEPLFRVPRKTPEFIKSPVDLSDVDPALVNSPWAAPPPAFPTPAGQPGGAADARRLQIAPSVQRLLEKEPTLRSLFLSVGWPVFAPPVPRSSAPSDSLVAVPPAPANAAQQQQQQHAIANAPQWSSAPVASSSAPAVGPSAPVDGRPPTPLPLQAPTTGALVAAGPQISVDPLAAATPAIITASTIEPASAPAPPARPSLAEQLAAPPRLDFGPMAVDAPAPVLLEPSPAVASTSPST